MDDDIGTRVENLINEIDHLSDKASSIAMSEQGEVLKYDNYTVYTVTSFFFVCVDS